MKQRTISALIACLIVIPTFLIGGLMFKTLAAILAVLAYKEILCLKKSHNRLPNSIKAIGLICLLCLIFANYDGYALFLGFSYQAVALTLLALLLPTLFIKKNYDTKDAFYLIGVILYIGILFNSLIMIEETNKNILLYLVMTICATDIFAFIIGSLIGKHKIAPVISPKKSVEGCIAGSLIGTIIGSLVYIALFKNYVLYRVIIITLILSISGQFGDLLFSKIKRENEIKDFSNIMPGHGGILDRLDSLSFAILMYIIISTVF